MNESGNPTEKVEKAMETQSIHKDMRIAAILAANPNRTPMLARIMTDFGIHCVGCGAAGHETLEQGVLGHGYSKKELDHLIGQLNDALADDTPVLTPVSEFGLTLSQAASTKVKALMTQHGIADGILRVEVQEGGCSGYKYELRIVDEAVATDWQSQQDGINIAVDQTGLEKINGMEIDYVDSLNDAGFKFNNPNATQGCGCGKSFR